jgi:hypothetical protein
MWADVIRKGEQSGQNSQSNNDNEDSFCGAA